METDKPEKSVQKIRIEQHSLAGGFWCAAWLFTIGFLHLSFWKAVLALIVWAYYIGHYAGRLAH
ncbi:MAG: hypothetical protein WA476_11725 [Acidobacteriaceae bacterium]